ncbi:MAG: hypothetical protein P9F75_13425 [Candidatus Contendobacter sp.]|nr:hypothetical protein [Candidatus Contendobacter sp.]
MIVAMRQWSHVRLLVMAVFLSLAGCAIQLAPPYDKNVVDGLSSVSMETMTLLAATSQGTEKSTFSSREDKYNTLIGKLDALALLAGARPMPKNKATDTINKLLEKRGVKPMDDDDSIPPSVHSIKKVSETLTKMRDTDKKQGVTAYEAQAFKGQIVIYFDQAITYENFLQR